MAILLGPPETPRPLAVRDVLAQVARYPRLRYMGSKYQVIPYLVDVFAGLDFDTAIDPFSGSGVVAYALKTMGKSVTTSDYLNFPSTVARATIENPGVQLDPSDIDLGTGPRGDDRDFIRLTYGGLYFADDDHGFLDSAWSDIDQLPE
jgi:adenine-specific DNA-methyltransferase